MSRITFTGLDPNRLREICRLWNADVGDDFPLRPELVQQNMLSDPYLNGGASWMAIDPAVDRLVGFIAVKRPRNRESPSASIYAMLVDHAYRNRGIGSELYARAKRELDRLNIRRLTAGQGPSHLFPGIPSGYTAVKAWFEARGFCYKSTFYDLLCRRTDPIPPPRRDGVSIGPMGPADRAGLLTFLHDSFPGSWALQAGTYFQKGGDGREYVVIEQDGKIIGFCRLNDARSLEIAPNVNWAPLFPEAIGGIGPLGVSERVRGQGYGLAIVQAAMHELQQRGINTFVIDWTNLVDFYGKLGAKIWKRYDVYVNEMEA